jgi:hypothetical protein
MQAKAEESEKGDGTTAKKSSKQSAKRESSSPRAFENVQNVSADV